MISDNSSVFQERCSSIETMVRTEAQDSLQHMNFTDCAVVEACGRFFFSQAFTQYRYASPNGTVALAERVYAFREKFRCAKTKFC